MAGKDVKGPNQSGNNLNMLNNPNILTGMSHEMRTHMNAIVAFSFLMNNKENGDNERQEFSNYIINSCEQLMVLFDNFLDSAIIDTGNSVNELRKCDLSDFLNEQLSDFRILMSKYEDKSIELILDDKCIKPGDVYIDIHKVSRVIRNLFLNALENTNSGYIRIGFNVDHEKVTFYILDSGQGFQKSRLLLSTRNENDFQGNFDDTQAAVSLILAKKLVGLMHGDIWVEKNGLTGTGIYFSLPVKELATTSGPDKREIRTRMAI
ncbi:MAG: HAMP domain-containing histidine kinase [Bacteroidales bacterium]|nr:HAMP domain-containing histidine kinase [Bacteroidales bacterium]